MIGVSRAAVWLPDQYESARDIAARSNLPEWVVREKMGIVRKCRAPAHIHTSDMAQFAAEEALRDVERDSIDLLLWTGSEYKDYAVWSAGIHLQERLGLRKAWAFDIAARCSTNVVALKLVKSMMSSDQSLNRALLCGGHRTGDLVNYRDPDARFLYNLSDGGSALLVERGEKNPILESAVITDGRFSLDVVLRAGGTKHPSRDGIVAEQTYLQVTDLEGMRERLSQTSINHFVQVIQKAAAGRPIDYLALLHMKRSAHDAILDQLGLGQDQSVYLDHFGHFGAPDQVVSLGVAEMRGLLRPGHHVVLASAGIGYTWSAVAMRWDQPLFSNYNAIGGHLERT